MGDKYKKIKNSLRPNQGPVNETEFKKIVSNGDAQRHRAGLNTVGYADQSRQEDMKTELGGKKGGYGDASEFKNPYDKRKRHSNEPPSATGEDDPTEGFYEEGKEHDSGDVIGIIKLHAKEEPTKSPGTQSEDDNFVGSRQAKIRAIKKLIS